MEEGAPSAGGEDASPSGDPCPTGGDLSPRSGGDEELVALYDELVVAREEAEMVSSMSDKEKKAYEKQKAKEAKARLKEEKAAQKAAKDAEKKRLKEGKRAKKRMSGPNEQKEGTEQAKRLSEASNRLSVSPVPGSSQHVLRINYGTVGSRSTVAVEPTVTVKAVIDILLQKPGVLEAIEGTTACDLLLVGPGVRSKLEADEMVGAIIPRLEDGGEDVALEYGPLELPVAPPPAAVGPPPAAVSLAPKRPQVEAGPINALCLECSTWSETAEKKEFDTSALTKHDRQRQEVIFETIATEVQFVEDCEVIIQELRAPLLSLGCLTEECVNDIFQNINEVLTSARCLRDKFLALRGESIFVAEIGSIYNEHTAEGGFACYQQYLCEFGRVQDMVVDLEKQVPEFKEFVKTARANPALKALNLVAWLIKPVQRVMKYPLLLRDLIKATADDHSDLPPLEKAFGDIGELLDEINEQKRELELKRRFKEVAGKITGFEAFKFSRQLIREGDVCLMRKADKVSERHAFLFSDTFVLTKVAKKGRFNAKEIFHLGQYLVSDCADDEVVTDAFKLSYGDNEVTVVAADANDKDGWFSNIKTYSAKTRQNQRESLISGPVLVYSTNETAASKRVSSNVFNDLGNARVLYSYTANLPDELTIEEHDVVQLLSGDDGSGWSRGRCNGQEGVFPTAYVKPLSGRRRSSVGTVQELATNQHGEVKPKTLRASESVDDLPNALGSSAREAPPTRTTRAIFPYEAQRDDELTFKANDVVIVETDDEDGWSYGFLDAFDGKKGFFPTGYVQEHVRPLSIATISRQQRKRSLRPSASTDDLRASASRLLKLQEEKEKKTPPPIPIKRKLSVEKAKPQPPKKPKKPPPLPPKKPSSMAQKEVKRTHKRTDSKDLILEKSVGTLDQQLKAFGFSASKKERMSRHFVPIVDAKDTRAYSLEELMKFPSECDPECLESYLSDDEFIDVFGMGRAGFAGLPEWKKGLARKKHGLAAPSLGPAATIKL